MATRLYFSKIAPNVILHGRSNGAWTGQQGYLSKPGLATHWTWRLTPTKSAAGAKFNATCHSNQQGDYDAMLGEWMTYPLDAQTVSGTLDLCAQTFADWTTTLTSTPDSVVRFKVHVYIAVGQTRTVRHVLLDNYIDPTDLWTQGTASVVTWQSLTAPQAITSGDAQAGDVIVVELGARIVSSPTPTPTYPPTASTAFQMYVLGADSATADATPGSTNTALNAWLELSDTLTFQAAPAPPSNELCVNALPIVSVPYDSGYIDTSAASGAQREVFWSFTAPTSGRMIAHNFGSNYGTEITFQANCAGSGIVPGVTGITGSNTLAMHRSQSNYIFDVVAGTSFIIRCWNSTDTFNASNGGGLLRLRLLYAEQTPAVDDLYIPSGAIAVFREGEMINLNPDLEDFFPTGVAIDYTQRPMETGSGTNTSVRLLVGLFAFEMVEVFDILTLNDSSVSELDIIADPFTLEQPGLAQMYCTAEGLLYTGWWGNGFLYVLGLGGLRPAQLNTVSDDPDYGAIKVIDATHGDSQPGAPFTATLIYPEPDKTAPWALTIDEAAAVMYYTSSGLYLTLGGQTVQRFNVENPSQLSTFVTLPAGGSYDDGVKGLALLSDRSLLICNATQVVRVSSDGVVLATYTPSQPLDSSTLIDIKVTADEQFFWVVDLDSNALFKFSLLTGVEVGYYQTYMRPGTLVQMALYNPAPLPPAPEPDADTETTEIRWLRRAPVISDENVRLFHTMFTLDMQTGTGLVSGQGSDPQVMLRYSDDSGQTWSQEHWRGSGRMGDYRRRVIWRRLGASRNRVYEIVGSDPCIVGLLDGFTDVSRGAN